MNSSQPSGYTQNVQKTEPWGPAIPHLQQIFGRAEQLYGTGGPAAYQGPLVAPTAPETVQAQTMRADRARMGDPLTRGAKGYTSGVLSGEYAAPKFADSRLGRTATDYAAKTAGGGFTGQNPFASSRLGGAAQDYATRAIGGGFLGQNPYLDAMVDRASQGVVRNYQRAIDPGLRSRAILTGRPGANETTRGLRRQQEEVLGETLGGIATDIYGRDYGNERAMQQQAAMAAPGMVAPDIAAQQYERGLQQQAAFASPSLAAPDIGQYEAERGRMEAAANRAPGLGALDYADIEALGQVGAERESQAERQIGEAVQKHTYAQEQPYEALRRYLDFVRGAPGGKSITQEPIYRNRAAGALGGGLGAAQLAAMIPGVGWPWVLGAGAGGALLGGM